MSRGDCRGSVQAGAEDLPRDEAGYILVPQTDRPYLHAPPPSSKHPDQAVERLGQGDLSARETLELIEALGLDPETLKPNEVPPPVDASPEADRNPQSYSRA